MGSAGVFVDGGVFDVRECRGCRKGRVWRALRSIFEYEYDMFFGGGGGRDGAVMSCYLFVYIYGFCCIYIGVLGLVLVVFCLRSRSVMMFYV